MCTKCSESKPQMFDQSAEPRNLKLSLKIVFPQLGSRYTILSLWAGPFCLLLQPLIQQLRKLKDKRFLLTFKYTAGNGCLKKKKKKKETGKGWLGIPA